MKRWKLRPPPPDAPVPGGLALAAIAGIGSPRLADRLLQGMQTLLPASHCTVFALQADGRILAVSTASSYGDAAGATAREYVRHGFGRQDSNMVWLAARKTPRQSQTWMSHQFAEEVADAEYRRICYGDTGIRERTSVLLLLDDGQRIAVSFYRNLAFPGFSEAEFEKVEVCAPVLAAAVVAHVRATQVAPTAGSAPPAADEKLLAALPRREREVLSQILAGHTSREIAARLALSLTTVLTYRYRAFRRLGLRSQRELMVWARQGGS